MMDPFPTRFQGINYYVMYLEHYIVYCKIDQRVAKDDFQAIQIRREEPLTLVARELGPSKERAIMIEMLKNQMPE